MGSFHPFYLFPIPPTPASQSLVLRAAHHLVVERIVKDCDCVFMIGIFSNLLASREAPNCRLAVPRSGYEVFIIYEVDGGYWALIVELGDGRAMGVEAIELAISASR